jgi:16S rRNA (cytosine967-C5)-methyltransferase
MTAASAIRAAAARTVAEVLHRGRSLDAALAVEASAERSERALLRVLAFGTVRWALRLRPLAMRLLAGPTRQLEPEIEALVLVGLYQLLDTEIAPHAAVSETVEATHELRRRRAAGLVNAVLRRAQREAPALLAELDRELAIRTAHPRWLVDRLAREHTGDLERVLDANNAHPPLWLRVNRRRADVASVRSQLAAAGHETAVHAHAPDAVRLLRPLDVRTLPEFQAGLVSVQDAAAQLAAPMLDVAPGQRVLDACAAPGGKTCHVIELQPELGEMLAVDLSADRLLRVEENLDRLGMSARLIAADATRPDDWWDGAAFDRILLDVPCSATGVIRRHPDVKLLRRDDDIESLVAGQDRLLAALWPLLVAGGRLLYASCSALRAENAAVIERFLAARPDACDKTMQRGDWFSPGPGLRIPAGTADMDGFYYACLEKRSG